METKADELLRGAIDVHVHGYPEFDLDLKGRTDDVQLLNAAKSAGLRAIVLKSQMWPTFTKTYYLQKMVEGIKIFGGITLNTICGGLSDVAVRSAAKLGAKIVWMPTFSAKNDIDRNGFASVFFKKHVSPQIPGEPITILTKSGELRQETIDIINVVKEYDLVLSTGHLSPQESLILIREAYRRGLRRLLVAHPLSKSVGATIEQQRELAKHAFIEHTFITSMPLDGRSDPKVTVEAIHAVGSDSVILSTDSIFHWNPPQPEIFRMQVSSMLELGVREKDVKKMIQGNPAQLLGI